MCTRKVLSTYSIPETGLGMSDSSIANVYEAFPALINHQIKTLFTAKKRLHVFVTENSIPVPRQTSYTRQKESQRIASCWKYSANDP